MAQVVSRTQERVIGAVIGLGGLALLGYGWWIVSQGGGPRFVTSFAGPFFAVTGWALVAFPGFRTERAASGETGGGLTRRWRRIVSVALTLALVNFLLAQSGWAPL